MSGTVNNQTLVIITVMETQDPSFKLYLATVLQNWILDQQFDSTNFIRCFSKNHGIIAFIFWITRTTAVGSKQRKNSWRFFFIKNILFSHKSNISFSALSFREIICTFTIYFKSKNILQTKSLQWVFHYTFMSFSIF